jgi:hypothetical protein
MKAAEHLPITFQKKSNDRSYYYDGQVNYGSFMQGLVKENIQLNTKVLSELSIHEPHSIKALVGVSHTAFPENRAVKRRV